MKPRSIVSAALLFAALSAAANVAAYHEPRHADPAAMTEGEVKKVDKAAAKLTIKHGPLKNLDMPGMTMVFRVKDPVMFEKLNVGDKIKFVAEKIDGAYTVTELERAN
ncbi:MAG TPA: copper-binding protein [Burkholderiales bacterium]|nr:copper-binding protein [Burkholderiales bacterium]